MTVTLGVKYANDATGWTTATFPGASNVIYVSAAGNDTTGNGTVANPYATCLKAMTDLNARASGTAYWILLREGDDFNNGGAGDRFGELRSTGAGNGTGAGDPVFIGSYDQANPTVLSPGTGGKTPRICVSTVALNGIGDSAPIYTVARGHTYYTGIVNVEFYASDRDPSNTATIAPFFNNNAPSLEIDGINPSDGYSWFLLEGVVISFFADGVIAQSGNQSGLLIRRSIIVDQYLRRPIHHSQGIFISNNPNFAHHENLFDKNGGNSSLVVSQAVTIAPGGGGAPAVVTFPSSQVTSACLRNGSYITLSGSPPSPFQVPVTVGYDVYVAQNVSGNTCNLAPATLSNDSVNTTGSTVIVTNSGSCNATIIDCDYVFYNHNHYINGIAAPHDTTTITPAMAQGNISAGWAEDQFRSGGTVDNCLYLNNPWGLIIGAPVSGVQYVENNVFLAGVIGRDDAKSFGLMGTPYAGDNYNVGTVSFLNNITANPQGTMLATLTLDANYTGTIVDRNIHFACGAWISSSASGAITNDNRDDAGTNNNTSPAGGAPSEPFPDPTHATMGDYYSSIGNPHGFASTTDGFISACRVQRKNNWDSRLTAHDANNFIRGKFGIVSYPITSRSAHGRSLKQGF